MKNPNQIYDLHSPEQLEGAPEFCPVTGLQFWGRITHPELGEVATYGGPFDTYTTPKQDEDGEWRSERYDHDAGQWVEGGEPWRANELLLANNRSQP